MELVVLRARAVCESCRSKLPPRTEAWWDAEARRAVCVTCERYDRLEATAPDEPTLLDGAPGVDHRRKRILLDKFLRVVQDSENR